MPPIFPVFATILGICFLIVGVIIGPVIYFSNKSKNKLQAKQAALPFAPALVEQICRAMCIADGREPEGDGSMREYHTDDYPGKYKWELYKSQAYRFLMVYDLVKKYEEDQRFDGK